MDLANFEASSRITANSNWSKRHHFLVKRIVLNLLPKSCFLIGKQIVNLDSSPPIAKTTVTNYSYKTLLNISALYLFLLIIDFTDLLYYNQIPLVL